MSYLALSLTDEEARELHLELEEWASEGFTTLDGLYASRRAPVHKSIFEKLTDLLDSGS